LFSVCGDFEGTASSSDFSLDLARKVIAIEGSKDSVGRKSDGDGKTEQSSICPRVKVWEEKSYGVRTAPAKRLTLACWFPCTIAVTANMKCYTINPYLLHSIF
jgi:hypothetical protein